MDDLDNLLNQVSDVVKPLVTHIEQKIPTTKDHYGDYMTAISSIAAKLPGKPSSNVYLAIGVALQRAGASKAGVQSALRVMGHI